MLYSSNLSTVCSVYSVKSREYSSFFFSSFFLYYMKFILELGWKYAVQHLFIMFFRTVLHHKKYFDIWKCSSKN